MHVQWMYYNTVPSGVETVKILLFAVFLIGTRVTSSLVRWLHLCRGHRVHRETVVRYRGDGVECEVNALTATESSVVAIATAVRARQG